MDPSSSSFLVASLTNVFLTLWLTFGGWPPSSRVTNHICVISFSFFNIIGFNGVERTFSELPELSVLGHSKLLFFPILVSGRHSLACNSPKQHNWSRFRINLFYQWRYIISRWIHFHFSTIFSPCPCALFTYIFQSIARWWQESMET